MKLKNYLGKSMVLITNRMKHLKLLLTTLEQLYLLLLMEHFHLMKVEDIF